MIYLLLFVCACGAWFVSTVAAGGATMLLLPVLGFIIAPNYIAPTITIAAIISNPVRALMFWRFVDWRIIRWLLPGSVMGAALGAYTFTLIPAQLLQILLGVFLISTVWQFRFVRRQRLFAVNLPHFYGVGLVVSFISGLIGGTGPVMNPFFLNYGADKETLVATKAINSFFIQLTKLVTYFSFGAINWQAGTYGLILGAGAIVGTYWAKNHLLTIDTAQFRRYTLILMPVCGGLLLSKAFFVN